MGDPYFWSNSSRMKVKKIVKIVISTECCYSNKYIGINKLISDAFQMILVVSISIYQFWNLEFEILFFVTFMAIFF